MEDLEIALLGDADDLGGMTADDAARRAWQHQKAKEIVTELSEWKPEELEAYEPET